MSQSISFSEKKITLYETLKEDLKGKNLTLLQKTNSMGDLVLA